jgi:hypothetical protein
MKQVLVLPAIIFLLMPPDGIAQTGHVINDIGTLFGKYHELKQNMWSIRSEVSALRSEVASSSPQLDSLKLSIQQIVKEAHAADSISVAALDSRLRALEAGAASPPSTMARNSSASLPLVLGAGAFLLSLATLLVLLLRPRAKTIAISPAPLVAPPAPPVMEPERREPGPPVFTASREATRESQRHIPTETLSKRSEIMRQFGLTPSKSMKSFLQAERKRTLTDRASELLLLTNRMDLTERERELAEEEIADILREMMELR